VVRKRLISLKNPPGLALGPAGFRPRPHFGGFSERHCETEAGLGIEIGDCRIVEVFNERASAAGAGLLREWSRVRAKLS
jgi:hypothetical protein